MLASRLSEDASVSVLLLERGRVRDNVLSRIPLLSSNFFLPALQVVGDRFSEPVAAAAGRRARLWGAEAVGGSSRINVMLVTRGPPAGYDHWATALGLSDWSYDRVEPYFVKMETAASHPRDPYRGHDGELHLVGGGGEGWSTPVLEADQFCLSSPSQRPTGEQAVSTKLRVLPLVCQGTGCPRSPTLC